MVRVSTKTSGWKGFCLFFCFFVFFVFIFLNSVLHCLIKCKAHIYSSTIPHQYFSLFGHNCSNYSFGQNWVMTKVKLFNVFFILWHKVQFWKILVTFNLHLLQNPTKTKTYHVCVNASNGNFASVSGINLYEFQHAELLSFFSSTCISKEIPRCLAKRFPILWAQNIPAWELLSYLH